MVYHCVTVQAKVLWEAGVLMLDAWNSPPPHFSFRQGAQSGEPLEYFVQLDLLNALYKLTYTIILDTMVL